VKKPLIFGGNTALVPLFKSFYFRWHHSTKYIDASLAAVSVGQYSKLSAILERSKLVLEHSRAQWRRECGIYIYV